MYVEGQLLIHSCQTLAQGAGLTDAVAVRLAGNLLRFHGTAAKKFGHTLIADPVLLMLLELFVARFNGRATTVKVLALSSGVPSSTAQRWIDRLETEKLLAKQTNPIDRRSAVVRLTDEAAAMVKATLGGLAAELAAWQDGGDSLRPMPSGSTPT
jgi:DNA-binding MarR family transcriptional regulator